MNTKTFNQLLNQLLEEHGEIQRQMAPLQDKLKSLKGDIKKGMVDEEMEKFNNGKYSVNYITIKSTKLDQKLAIDLMTPEQREKCIYDTETKRFQITELKQK